MLRTSHCCRLYISKSRKLHKQRVLWIKTTSSSLRSPLQSQSLEAYDRQRCRLAKSVARFKVTNMVRFSQRAKQKTPSHVFWRCFFESKVSLHRLTRISPKWDIRRADKTGRKTAIGVLLQMPNPWDLAMPTPPATSIARRRVRLFRTLKPRRSFGASVRSGFARNRCLMFDVMAKTSWFSYYNVFPWAFHGEVQYVSGT